LRGQTSLEMLLLLCGILIAATALAYFSRGRSEEQVALGGARLGVENAIAGLRENGGEFSVEESWLEGGTVVFRVAVRGSSLSDTEIENRLRENALSFLWYTLTGSFPSQPGSVRGYDVEVRIERL
jgi:hypothetical protein